MKTPIVFALTLVSIATLSTAAPLVGRGIGDNTLNNADIIDHLSLINSMVNSNPQDSENRNANTKASGPGDNSSISKQGGEGIYYKGGHCYDDDCHHHHWRRGLHKRSARKQLHKNKDVTAARMRMVSQMLSQDVEDHGAATIGKRGLLDNTLNNADIIDHVEALNSMVNSNPQDSENRNANTKASGPGDNSDLSKQGGEGIYYKGGHCDGDDCHHHHWRRGVLDNTLNNADIIDHVSLLDSMREPQR
ncbi:uncharacterized protein VTP21DRAFT_11242 [Calcarisporiella thermophila]|uniref:uncharacterized protein n=1 Tax=Calcarisporiella thermophila TaxID=911321 RepID=UPI003743CFD4